MGLPMFQLLDIGGRLKRRIANAMDPVAKGKAGMTQQQYNKLFEPPEMQAAKSYALVLKLFFLSVIFTPLLPIASLVAFLGLTFYYFAFKYKLLRKSRRTYRQGHEVSEVATGFVYSSVWLLALSTWWFLTPSLRGDGLASIRKAGLYLAVAAIIATLGKGMGDKCLYSLGLQMWQRDTSSDVDYYEAQKWWPKHGKYHTSHPVYLHIEQIAMHNIQRRVPGVTLPWRPGTGNIEDPTGKVKLDDETQIQPPSVTAASSSGTSAAMETAAAATAEAEIMEDPTTLALERMRSNPMKKGQWTSGMMALVSGLVAAAAQEFNGTTCKLLDRDTTDVAEEKWLVELANGKKARIPVANLTLLSGP